MQKFTLEIRMDNAAFEEADGYEGKEVARILEKLAKLLDGVPLSKGFYNTLFDINGNRVGEWKVTA